MVEFPWPDLPYDEKMYGEFSVAKLAMWCGVKACTIFNGTKMTVFPIEGAKHDHKGCKEKARQN